MLTSLFARLDQYIAEGEVDGIGLAVAHRGQTVAEWYGGYAKPDLPVGKDVLWPLASISKLYTAALILRLVEASVLTLSTPVTAILPQFLDAKGGSPADGREAMTVRHLLTHTAGMIYESPQMAERLAQLVPMTGLLTEAYQAPLMFKPGQAHSYADFHYLLLGEVATVVTGRSFAELVREWVLEPMGLPHTFMPPSPAEYARTAHVKGALAEGTVGAMYNSPHALSLAHPAFGTVATAADLLRFGLHFAPTGPCIHSAATVRAMTMDQTGGQARGWHPAGDSGEGEGLPQPWGYGFYFNTPSTGSVFGDLAPPGCFGHGGASGCNLFIDPVDDIVIAYVSNTHVRIQRDLWRRRIHVVLNMVLAELT